MATLAKVYGIDAKGRHAKGKAARRWAVEYWHEGKRYRPSFATKVEADARRERILVRSSQNLPPWDEPTAATAVKPTVADLSRWYDEAHGQRVASESSRDRLTLHRETIERSPLASKIAEEVGVTDLEDFFAWRAKDVRFPGKDVKHVRAVFKAAARSKRLKLDHVFSEAGLSKDERKKLMPAWSPKQTIGQPITDEERAKILAAFPADEDLGRVVRFALATGARKGQACNLSWSRVKAPTGEHGYQDVPPGFWLLPQKKAARFVDLTDAVRAILPQRPVGGGYVFGDPGDLYGRLTRAWRDRVQKGLGIKKRIHDTRHTYGTILRQHGDTADVSKAMGITPAMVEVYAQHEQSERVAAMHERAQRQVLGAAE